MALPRTNAVGWGEGAAWGGNDGPGGPRRASDGRALHSMVQGRGCLPHCGTRGARERACNFGKRVRTIQSDINCSGARRLPAAAGAPTGDHRPPLQGNAQELMSPCIIQTHPVMLRLRSGSAPIYRGHPSTFAQGGEQGRTAAGCPSTSLGAVSLSNRKPALVRAVTLLFAFGLAFGFDESEKLFELRRQRGTDLDALPRPRVPELEFRGVQEDATEHPRLAADARPGWGAV